VKYIKKYFNESARRTKIKFTASERAIQKSFKGRWEKGDNSNTAHHKRHHVKR
jgi:hypothetical protein